MRITMAISLLIAAQASALSTVSYTVELGGDNHASAYKAGSPQPFTRGSTAAQTYAIGQTITWDTVVEASGIHSQGDFPIYGMANIVFDLELHSGAPTGPLAASARWFSTINDGTGGDPRANAAFTFAYNVGGNGPGRVIDPQFLGGPHLGVYMYPSSTAYPPGSTAPAGTLRGMGAGYSSFDLGSVAGVGMDVLPNGLAGLGVVPVAEGQLDTSNLLPGTYYLEVLPGRATNVLTENGYLNPGSSFAVQAEQTFGSDVSFVLTPEPGAALLLACAGLLARRRHS